MVITITIMVITTAMTMATTITTTAMAIRRLIISRAAMFKEMRLLLRPTI